MYWRLHHRKEGDLKRFEETMDEVLSECRLTNAKLYMDGDELLVDAVFDYDDMWRQIGLLAERTGNSLPDSLPHAKGGHRTDRRPAEEIQTADQKRRIQHSCAIEFERFGYEP